MRPIVCVSGVELLMEYMEGALRPMSARPSRRTSLHVRDARRSLRMPRDATHHARRDHERDARRPGSVAAGCLARGAGRRTPSR